MCVYCGEGEVNRLVGAFYVISLNTGLGCSVCRVRNPKRLSRRVKSSSAEEGDDSRDLSLAVGTWGEAGEAQVGQSLRG